MRKTKAIVLLLGRLTRAYQCSELVLAETNPVDSIEALRYLPLFEEKNRGVHLHLVFLVEIRVFIDHHPVTLLAGLL